MIPYDTVTAWGVSHPWPTREQIEQDMLLSKALCEIYSNDFLAGELVFRGGTAIHKLVLPQPYRYSEDLDFVRSNAGGIGGIMRELTELGKRSGYIVKTRIGQYPKIYWQCAAQTGYTIRIKIEINTYERSPALPLTKIGHAIHTAWYTGKADVRVFQNEELAATKIRALYQRAKGRDLFDLWLLINEIGIDVELSRLAFAAYRPEGLSSRKAIENLERKLGDEKFRTDIVSMVNADINDYRIEEAASQVIDMYLSRL